jgi:DNA-binding NarL/FixJ family response regulator
MRVILADDSVLLRTGLARLLVEAGFEIAGQAGDAEQLLALAEREHPDAAIVDIRMPPTHTDEGLRAARELHRRYPAMGVLVLSQHVHPTYAGELLEGGATGMGYLLKDRVSNVSDLTESLQRVASGGCVLDPEVVAQLVARRRRGDDPLDELSDREREVLALMAEGRSNRAIGQRLFITEHTVEKHIQAIFAKLALPATADDHRRVLAVLTFLNSG